MQKPAALGCAPQHFRDDTETVRPGPRTTRRSKAGQGHASHVEQTKGLTIYSSSRAERLFQCDEPRQGMWRGYEGETPCPHQGAVPVWQERQSNCTAVSSDVLTDFRRQDAFPCDRIMRVRQSHCPTAPHVKVVRVLLHCTFFPRADLSGNRNLTVGESF